MPPPEPSPPKEPPGLERRVVGAGRRICCCGDDEGARKARVGENNEHATMTEARKDMGIGMEEAVIWFVVVVFRLFGRRY